MISKVTDKTNKNMNIHFKGERYKWKINSHPLLALHCPHLHPSPVCPPTLDTLASLSVPHPSPTLAMCTKYSLQHAICYKQNSVQARKSNLLSLIPLTFLLWTTLVSFLRTFLLPKFLTSIGWFFFFPSFVLRTLRKWAFYPPYHLWNLTSIFPMIIKCN